MDNNLLYFNYSTRCFTTGLGSKRCTCFSPCKNQECGCLSMKEAKSPFLRKEKDCKPIFPLPKPELCCKTSRCFSPEQKLKNKSFCKTTKRSPCTTTFRPVFWSKSPCY